MNIEVKETEKDRWGLYVNGILIGDSKARFDADHAKVMLLKALTPLITHAADSLEECAGLLAEVHIRFGAPKVLDAEAEHDSWFTFGDAARAYAGEANELRRLLAPPITAADVSGVPTEEEIRKRRPGLFKDVLKEHADDTLVGTREERAEYLEERAEEALEEFTSEYIRGVADRILLRIPGHEPAIDHVQLGLELRGAKGVVRDVDAYLKMIATAGEEFCGQRNDARRRMIVQAAAGAADNIIMHYADGTLEELELFTAQVAHEFFSKMVQSAQMALFRKEMLDGPKGKDRKRHSPEKETLPGSPQAE